MKIEFGQSPAKLIAVTDAYTLALVEFPLASNKKMS